MIMLLPKPSSRVESPFKRAKAWATGSVAILISSSLRLLVALDWAAEEAKSRTSISSSRASSTSPSSQFKCFGWSCFSAVLRKQFMPRLAASTASSYRSNPIRARACRRYGLYHPGRCNSKRRLKGDYSLSCVEDSNQQANVSSDRLACLAAVLPSIRAWVWAPLAS